MTTGSQHSYTATGIVRLERDLPVEAIGEALMDSAADLDENTSVASDIVRSLIEIEAIVSGADELDALANAKLVIHQICDQADLPVNFAENRRPRPSEWHLIDDAAVPPLLAPA
jgi:hypothetical protein